MSNVQSVNFASIDKDFRPDWYAMLNDVLATPGTISAAYRTFHNYSVGNAMLATMQATARGMQIGPLASFNRWKELGRQVKKGEKAMALLMPVQVKAKQDAAAVKQDADESEDRSFTIFALKRNWFMESQTEPMAGVEQLPIEQPAIEWNKQAALQALQINQEDYTQIDGNCQGYAHGNTIAINPVAALPMKTTFHELAHILLGHTKSGVRMLDGDDLARGIMEAEAESVAFICCATLGLPGLDEARGYVQHWLSGGLGRREEDAEQFRVKSAARIFSVANRILKAGIPA